MSRKRWCDVPVGRTDDVVVYTRLFVEVGDEGIRLTPRQIEALSRLNKRLIVRPTRLEFRGNTSGPVISLTTSHGTSGTGWGGFDGNSWVPFVTEG